METAETADAARDGARTETETRTGVLLTVAYDGTDFRGWASQRDVRTVQETLRGAVRAIDPDAGEIFGASRTDAGVHAEGQMAAFNTTKDIPPKGWTLGVNQHLPDDVAVRAARHVPLNFNPRFCSKNKRYCYSVLLDYVRDPKWRTRAWRVGAPVNVERVRGEAQLIVGTHDFAAFRSSADERERTERTIRSVSIDVREGGRILLIAIEGDAFLHNMVRILVGTLLDVGSGRLKANAISRALDSKNRRDAGITAPAHGLTLERIDLELPSEASESWPQ